MFRSHTLQTSVRWADLAAFLFRPVSRGRDAQAWIGIALATAVFAVGLVLFPAHPATGQFLTLAEGAAITLAAHRYGWCGAWSAFLIGTGVAVATTTTLIISAPRAVLPPNDLGLILGTNLVLTFLMGYFGAAATRTRTLLREFRAAEQRKRALVEAMPMGFVLLDLSGRITFSNQEARRLLSTDAPEEFGVSLRDLVTIDGWPELRRRIASRAKGEPLRVTIAGAHPVRTEWVFGEFQDETGIKVLGYFWDAEEKIRRDGESRALAAALRCLHDGVVMLGVDGTIRYANPAALKIWGISDRDTFRGGDLAGFIAPEDRELFHHRLADARTLSDEGELRLLRPDGVSTEALVTLAPVRVDGEELGVAAVVRDITATREMIRHAAVLDHRASLGRLVAGAAHDISDPLTAIVGTVDLAEHHPDLPAELRTPLAVIRTACHRAGKVLHGLVDFARQAPAERAAVELAEVVGRAVAVRRNYAAAAGIELTFHAAAPAPVAVDADRIRDLVLELVTNAEEAVSDSAEKRISVTIGRRGGMALLMVSDSGPGVPEELSARVFEPFFSTRTTKPGAGVGLAMVAGVVAAHQGRVSVGRGVLGGAQFAVELPLAEAAPARAPAPAEYRPTDAPEPLSVLVVDDEPSVLASIGRVLKRLGHTVHLAATGESAVRLAARRHVDLIISDLRMPGMSGRQLHARLTAEGVLPAADFLVATGDGADPEAVAFLQATGLPVLHKP
ncbi:MAG TPA: ATP-binding protein, partial [Gemmatimonadales bacterium]|nr:ATP-binding protein [Gemmatimonadales bacterium]